MFRRDQLYFYMITYQSLDRLSGASARALTNFLGRVNLTLRTCQVGRRVIYRLSVQLNVTTSALHK